MSKIKCFSFLSGLFFQLSISNGTALAADVPPGTKLATEQVLNVGIGAEAPTLDPQKIQDNVSARIAEDLYEGLVTEDEAGNIIPAIAHKWEVSHDSLTYTFHLRSDAKFSDGSPITANDAVYSIRRLVDPKVGSLYGEIISMIKNAKEVMQGKEKPTNLGVKAVNKETVEIVLNSPTPYFIKIMANSVLSFVKKENYDKYGDRFTQPENLVSSGPYKLKYWKIGDKITAERNPYYWNNKKTVVNTVNFFPISDTNSELQMFQTGQLDFTFDIPSDKFKSLNTGKIPGVLKREVRAQPYLSIYYIDFNLNSAPFKDNPKLRQAISMAIDRDILANDVTGRGEKSSYDIVPYGTSDYTQQSYAWEKLPRAQRIAQAQKLYKEAGYSRENPLTMNFAYNTNVLHKKVAIAFASMLEKNLGLKVNLVNMEWKVFLAERQAGNFQSSRDGWIADYNDASSFLDLFKSDNPQNNPKYKNPKYDKLIELSAIEMNSKKRQEILQQASSVLMNDYPVVPLYTYVTTHLVKSYVGGYSGRNALDHQFSRDFYIIDHQLTAQK